VIIERLDAWRGGAETSTAQFIDRLIELGAQVDVFTRSEVASRPGITVHTIRSSGPSRALQTLSFCRRADKQVAGGGYDVVHAISPSMVADVYQPRGGTYAEIRERNVAVRSSSIGRMLKRVTQCLDVKQRMMLRFERRMLAQPDRPLVIALSNYVVRQLTRHYGVPTKRIRKVFNAVNRPTVDEATRRQDRRAVRDLYAVDSDQVLVLMVAHNFRLKGLEPWIEALDLLGRVRRGRIVSLVVGKDRTTGWLRMVKRRGLENVLRFTGPTDNITPFYHAADLLVHPTFYDPCSRVVLEALAHGLPVITTRFDGASEAVHPGKNGYVIESPEDIEELAGKVYEMMNEQRRGDMAEAARALGREIDMRRHAREVFDVYEMIVNGRSKQ
jgi:UDP-glucose:(heptosyl)LPS alpha-1,3-glucosyltransferase